MAKSVHQPGCFRVQPFFVSVSSRQGSPAEYLKEAIMEQSIHISIPFMAQKKAEKENDPCWLCTTKNHPHSPKVRAQQPQHSATDALDDACLGLHKAVGTPGCSCSCSPHIPATSHPCSACRTHSVPWAPGLTVVSRSKLMSPIP